MKKLIKLLSFDIDDTTINTRLHKSKVNPHFLPLLYYSTAVAQAEGYPFGFFFSTHRTPLASQYLMVNTYMAAEKFGTSAALREARYKSLRYVKETVQVHNIKRVDIVCGDRYTPSVHNEEKDVKETEELITKKLSFQTKELSSSERQKLLTLQGSLSTKMHSRILHHSNDKSKSKKAHIEFSIGEFKKLYVNRDSEAQLEFDVLHLDDSKDLKLERTDTDDKYLNVRHYVFDENYNGRKSAVGAFNHFLSINKAALEEAGKHIGLDEFANNLLEDKGQEILQGPLLKDLAGIHYLLLTKVSSEQVDELVEKFHQKYDKQLNIAQKDALTYAEDLYTGLAMHAVELLSSIMLTSEPEKDAAAIIFLIKNSGCDQQNDLITLVKKFYNEKFHLLPSVIRNNFLREIKQSFGDFFINYFKVERIKRLLVSFNKIEVNKASPNECASYLKLLYKLYDNGSDLPTENHQGLFEKHLDLMIKMNRENKLDNKLLLDFVERVYPSLTFEKKQTFISVFLESEVQSSPEKHAVCTEILYMMKQQWRERASHAEVILDTVWSSDDPKKFIYDADPSDSVTIDRVKAGAGDLQKAMELQQIRDSAAEQKAEIIRGGDGEGLAYMPHSTTVSDAISISFDPTLGSRGVKALLDKSYVYSGLRKMDENGWNKIDESNIETLITTAKTRLREESDSTKKANIQQSIKYLEMVVKPQFTSIPAEIKNLIMDTAYWKSKRTVSIPAGIEKMQRLVRSQQSIKITDLDDIVQLQPNAHYKKFGLFSYSRDPMTEKFYEAIRNSTSLNELLGSSQFKEMIQDQKFFHFQMDRECHLVV